MVSLPVSGFSTEEDWRSVLRGGFRVIGCWRCLGVTRLELHRRGCRTGSRVRQHLRLSAGHPCTLNSTYKLSVLRKSRRLCIVDAFSVTTAITAVYVAES
jgi:hypothetical protein